MLVKKTYLPFILAMVCVVAASNYLVQFPVEAHFGSINLGEILTWGAFTYPVAFLVNDLTNRRFGPKAARSVVAVGFVLAIALSIWLATPRIAIASGSAFLVAQLLDISVFNHMRAATWWKAPLISSLLGSIIDTVLFFGIAFAANFGFVDAMFGMEDGSLAFAVPFLGIGTMAPLWISLAFGDFLVKTLVALAMLAPYGILLSAIRPVQTAQ